jgi:hypothetical protein
MKDNRISMEPISTLMRWFFPLLIRSDEKTYAEIASNAKELNPASVAVVMALWKVIIHTFSLSPESHKIVSSLYKQISPSDSAKSLFFEKFEEIYLNDDRFATTLSYLYQSSERIDGYVQGYIKGRLPGDVSTDAPMPEGKKKRGK